MLDPQPPRADRIGWSPAAMSVGAILVALAISGLLDDGGLIRHPWWIVPVLAVLLGCLAVAARTVRAVLAPPSN